MKPFYYKEKTSKAINDLLLTSPYFKEHPKKIPSVCRLLIRINGYNQKDKGYTSISHSTFDNIFGNEYTTIISALESIGILKVRRTFRKKHTLYRGDPGKCYDYLVTLLAQKPLADERQEYLYLLLTDKKAKANTLKLIKNRKPHSDSTDAIVTIRSALETIHIDFEAVSKVADTYEQGKRLNTYSLLVSLVRREYDLNHNEKDNRIWTPYAQLPAHIKTHIRLGKLPYQSTLDIRSCYPSLWAHYVNHGNSTLALEVEKYNKVFLTREVDPKEYLSSLLGINRSKIKEVLIQYFNGKGFKRNKFTRKNSKDPFFKFDHYLKTEYPNLYADWIKTDIRQTGNNIGKQFETKLMLDGSIYAKAKEMGMVLGYEYDGMSIYGNEGCDIQSLTAYIEQRSKELLGVPLVIMHKDNRQSLIAYMAEGQLERLDSALVKVDGDLSKERKKIWSNPLWLQYNKSTKHKSQLECEKVTSIWFKYRTLKEKQTALLEQMKQFLPLIVSESTS